MKNTNKPSNTNAKRIMCMRAIRARHVQAYLGQECVKIDTDYIYIY